METNTKTKNNKECHACSRAKRKKKEKNHSIKRIYEIIRIILNSHQKWITPIETEYWNKKSNSIQIETRDEQMKDILWCYSGLKI